MTFRRFTASLFLIGLAAVLVACGASDDSLVQTNSDPAPTSTIPATPDVDVLHVRELTTSGAQLRVTLPAIRLLKADVNQTVQLFLVLADPVGTYSYLLIPANEAGRQTDRFDLSTYPLDISINDNTTQIKLWILAINNTRYAAAETFGVDALAASLGIGFRTWLASGDPVDDPLAAIVSASEGALYEWFANIDVLGQEVLTFEPAETGWPTGLNSQPSRDGGLNAVFDLQFFPGENSTYQPTPTNVPATPVEQLVVDETFPGGRSNHQWFEGQDSTYRNHLTNGAYEIMLTAIEQGESGLSWGSMEGERFEDYRLEARVRLVEDEVVDGRYGIWFHYQDDYNFVYFGIRNTGEYRVAIIQRNSSRIEIQDWTPHPAIIPGAASNTLAVDTQIDGTTVLSINGEEVHRFTNDTFTSGSVAFFCYAQSVPTTCRLERLRIWTTEE